VICRSVFGVRGANIPAIIRGLIAVLWMAQAAVFWRGMDTIRKFIDFAGPAVYVVMFLLCGYLLYKGRLAREPQPVMSSVAPR